MDEQRVGAETAVEPGSATALAGPGAATARAGRTRATAIGRMQRGAGNRAVSAFLAREGETKAPAPAPVADPAATAGGAPAVPPPMPATSPPRKNYVFLMGDVKNDAFYTAASAFFKQHHPTAQFVSDKRTLAEIIETVNAGGVPVLNLFIVSHANEAGNLGFSMNAADLAKDKAGGDHKPRTEFKEVKDANQAKTLPTADVKLIDDFTKIEIKGCNIGRSQLMLDELDTAFGGHAEVIAPTHKQEYSIKGKKGVVTTEEALYQYSLEEPGNAPDPSPADLEARFRAKYPAVPGDRWAGYMKKVKRKVTKRPDYTHTQTNPPADDAKAVIARLDAANKFPARAGWTLTYTGRTDSIFNGTPAYAYEVDAERVLPDGSTETNKVSMTVPVPPDPAALKAAELAKSGRPGAYNWTVEDEITGTTLIRRVFSERTEWTIDEKVIDAGGTAAPAETDKTFYGRSTVQPPAPAAPAATP